MIERKSFAARLLLMWVVLAFPLLLSAQSRRRSVEQPSAPPTARSFAPDRLEAYLTDETIAYIRPGLKVKVNSITIAANRKLTVDVTFTDDFDQPIDRLGKVKDVRWTVTKNDIVCVCVVVCVRVCVCVCVCLGVCL